jgi:hypothetical protein
MACTEVVFGPGFRLPQSQQAIATQEARWNRNFVETNRRLFGCRWLGSTREIPMTSQNQNPGQQNQKPGQQQGGGQKPGQQQQDPNRPGQKPDQQGKDQQGKDQQGKGGR